MKRKTVKTVIYVLFGIASIMFLFGLVNSGSKENYRKHNPSKINIEIVSKNSYCDDDGVYYVEMDYQIENNTKSTLDTIKIKTLVYDESDSLIGTITTDIGKGYGDNYLSLNAGKTTIKSTYMQSWNPGNDALFRTLYVEKLSDLILEYEIDYAKFDDGYVIK